jgi:hypothetical protein
MTAHGIRDADYLISLYREKANIQASTSDQGTKDIDTVHVEIKRTIGEMRQQVRHHRREHLFAHDDRCWKTVLLYSIQAMSTNNAVRTLILRSAECRAWLRLPSRDVSLHSDAKWLAILNPIVRDIYHRRLHFLPEGSEVEVFRCLRSFGVDECIDGFWLSEK